MTEEEKKSIVSEETEEEIDIQLDDETEVVEQGEDKVENFQAQLVRALELNDKLINELQKKEQELSVFSEAKSNLESVISDKDETITQLQDQIESIKMEKFQEKVHDMSSKWIKKFGLPADKSDEVITMLSKFQSEEELARFESLMGLTKSNKPNPVPLTKNSNVLSEKFSEKKEDYESLSPKQKLDKLHEQLVAYENLKN